MRQSALLLLLLTLGCASCKGREPPPPPDDTGVRMDGGGGDAGMQAMVDRVEVMPASLTISVDEMQTLTAKVYDEDGNELTKTVNWSSSDETIATVANGVVTGVAEGSAVIVATVDSKSDTALITVVPQNMNPVDTVELDQASLDLLVGDSAQLTATARDAQGAVITGRPITWQSGDQAIATVSNTGLVNAVGAGSTQITATIEGKSDSATVNVTEPQIEMGDIDIDLATTYQTMTGWEGTAQMGQDECAGFANYQTALIDRAVNELGINRMRLEIASGVESSTDWYAMGQWNSHRYSPENDNSDPNSINAAGFQWSSLDRQIDVVVEPFRNALAARGEQLYVSLCFVDFQPGAHTFYHRFDPPEYGELMYAAFQHIQQAYGWVPDGLEVLLEPDTAQWANSEVGAVFVAAADRLQQEGFSPNYTLPSHTNMWAAVGAFDEINGNPNATGRITELSYHRYGGTGIDAAMAVGDRVRNEGVKSAMLEHIGSGIDDLMEDLTVAQNSAWAQFVIGFCGNQDGSKYYAINVSNPNNPVITLEDTARFFPQIFRRVRMGAVRHGLTIRDNTLTPLAFQNTDGKWVVAVRTQGAKNFKIGRLPAGTYGVYYTTGSALAVDGNDTTLTAGRALDVSIPAGGFVTVYQR